MVQEHVGVPADVDSKILARLVDQSSDSIGVVAVDGRCVYLNAAARRLLGFRAAADPVLQSLRPEHVVHPLDRHRWFDEILPAVVATGEWRGPVRLHDRSTGEAVEVAWQIFALADGSGRRTGYANIASDLRPQRQSRAEVNRLASMVDAVTRAAPIGVAFVDEQLRFRYVNDRLAEINGLDPAGHLGRTIAEVLPKLADLVVPSVRRALETGEAIVGLELVGETSATPGEPRVWLASYYPVDHIDGDANGIGIIVTDVTERRNLLDAERAAREVAESAMRRLQQLQAISDAALASLPLDELLEELMARLRDGLAVDTVRILLLSADRTHLAAGGALGFPLSVEEDVAIPIGKGYAGRIASMRAPLVVEDLSTMELVSLALRAAGVVSIAGVPLLLGEELIGVLHVGSVTSRVFSDEEVDVLELAAERIAMAIHRSRTYEAERLGHERAEFLSKINSEVTSHLDHRRLMEVVAAAAVPRLADWCSVFVLPSHGDGGPEVAIAHVDPAMMQWARQFTEQFDWQPDAPMGVPAVVRTGQPELHEHIDPALLDSLIEADPRLEPLRALRLRSSLIVPLVARGRVTGALQLVRAESGASYSSDDIALAVDVAARVGVALDNARLYEASEKVALTLLRSLLPDTLPEIPGVDLAVRYRPSAGDVGGDFYDVFSLGRSSPGPASGSGPDGWGIVVGDVCGKGVVAASMTALTRHTLRAAALSGQTPADMLELASRALHLSDPDGFCTAIAGILTVRPPGARFHFAAGGHPLPIVVDGNGVASYVGCHGTLLGLGSTGDRGERVVGLRPGEVLVLYTDGLTDLSPPVGLDAAQLLESVALAAGAGAGDTEAIADALLADLDARLEGNAQPDDVAVVVIAVRTGESGG